jgi:hypothetical protein
MMVFAFLPACDLFDGDQYQDTGDPYGLRDDDPDDKPDDDTAAEANNDGHLVYDTSVALFMYAGDGKLDADGNWLEGHFGNVWWGAETGSSVCDVLGEWSVAGPAEGGCFGCTWSFELRVDNTVAEGPECGDLAPVGAIDGQWDDMSYGFGWADIWEYRSGGSSFYLYNTVLIFISGGWYPFSYNFYGYDQVDGTAEDFSFVRPIVYTYAAYYPDI